MSAGPGIAAVPSGIELHAHSGRVDQGVPYRFQLMTHCGVDFATDFDGSFWSSEEIKWTRGDRKIGNPFQEGTMTLTGPDQARFDFTGGQISFQRHRSTRIVAGLCN